MADGHAGEVAVVTGAGRGFGREIALRLASLGYAVVATDIDAEAAATTAAEIGDRASSALLDVRDPDAHRAVAAAAGASGRLSVWVNNAGVAWSGKAWTLDDEQVRALVEINLLGCIWGSRAAVDAMAETGGGDIVNVASISGLGPVPSLGIYAGTKAGVVNFTVSLQGDLQAARVPIRVHAVCPDAAATDMTDSVLTDPEAAILFSAARLLTPERVASDVASVIGTRRVVLGIPRGRAATIRLASLTPRLGLRILVPLRWRGERRRRRLAKRPGD